MGRKSHPLQQGESWTYSLLLRRTSLSENKWSLSLILFCSSDVEYIIIAYHKDRACEAKINRNAIIDFLRA